jgi:hypothetical protein
MPKTLQDLNLLQVLKEVYADLVNKSGKFDSISEDERIKLEMSLKKDISRLSKLLRS